MKKIPAIAVFICFFYCTASAQQTFPQLLKETPGWEFERFTLPPGFAPGFPYKGVEELLFSPGMFKKDSVDYFSYSFAAQLNNTANMQEEDIKNYLLVYFKGLCSGTAKDRKLVIDTSAISVSIEKNKNAAVNETIYNATLDVFGVFADGAPVRLNSEIKVLPNADVNKTYLVFIASPQAKTEKIWQELYNIRDNFKMLPL